METKQTTEAERVAEILDRSLASAFCIKKSGIRPPQTPLLIQDQIASQLGISANMGSSVEKCLSNKTFSLSVSGRRSVIA
jgi:hypothetical protein